MMTRTPAEIVSAVNALAHLILGEIYGLVTATPDCLLADEIHPKAQSAWRRAVAHYEAETRTEVADALEEVRAERAAAEAERRALEAAADPAAMLRAFADTYSRDGTGSVIHPDGGSPHA